MANETRFTREAARELSEAKGEPAWLLDRRLESWDAFERLPMPDRQDEEWRRTDIRGLRLEDLAVNQVPRTTVPASPLGLEGGTYGGRVVQSNGAVIETELAAHLREQGVILCGLDEAVREHPELVRDRLMTEAIRPESGKFPALNGAFWSGGIFVYVPSGVECAIPLRSLYSLDGTGSAVFPHTVVVLESRAQLTYIEEYASGNRVQSSEFKVQGDDSRGLNGRTSLSAGAVEIFAGQDARLTLVTLQEYGKDVVDINTQRALLGRDSVVDWLVIGLGSGLTKSNIDVSMQGQGARTQMLGILWGHGHSHTNYQTVQDHRAPNCTSDLLYKGALTDEAVSIFSGKIRVEKGAQRTDAYQANRTVILSDKASAFPSPNLEIEANDVRCTHGASVGKVDAEQLFYLMSRGLPLDLATKMIVEGFLEEVLEREPGAAIRENLRDLIRRKIEERTG